MGESRVFRYSERLTGDLSASGYEISTLVCVVDAFAGLTRLNELYSQIWMDGQYGRPCPSRRNDKNAILFRPFNLQAPRS